MNWKVTQYKISRFKQEKKKETEKSENRTKVTGNQREEVKPQPVCKGSPRGRREGVWEATTPEVPS